MLSIYLGYFVDHESQKLYEIFVAGNNKKDAYERYCKFFETYNVHDKPFNIEILPISKFHYNGEIEDTDPSILELIIDSDYPKVWFNDDSDHDVNDYNSIMSDAYIDNIQDDEEDPEVTPDGK